MATPPPILSALRRLFAAAPPAWTTSSDAESGRLNSDTGRRHNWKRWGPYLAERQWGTVREDYSEDSSCWTYFPHEHARSRAYRWGEDGLLGFTDRQCRICFGLALWNGQDPFLKERLFGLVNHEGNHGEDVKETYFYLRNTPTHSYFKSLYKYPQRAFPYADLVQQNQKLSKDHPEYELADTGVFDDGRYFDITAEYAKAEPEDILIKITIKNCGPVAAPLHVLPQIWFRNIWSWQARHFTGDGHPQITAHDAHTLVLERETLGRYALHFEDSAGQRGPFLFTENNTHYEKLFQSPNLTPHVKDGFHAYIVDGDTTAAAKSGPATKATAPYSLVLAPGAQQVLRLRFRKEDTPHRTPFRKFDDIMAARARECEDYYDRQLPVAMNAEDREICKQAYAGLIFSKQFYYYPTDQWLDGDPGRPFPAHSIAKRRNQDWRHFFGRDIISMPDKWEYPWFAAWDLAFHMVPMARVDAAFAKKQLNLLLREWYMHPNGQIPAYEFALSDVNPPVHAWAAWRVYEISAAATGAKDRAFLAGVFHKLLLNFTWWVNRKDERGQGVFSGGFLGLDNIGIFDRGAPLPTGGTLQQADATAWMAFYCCCMLRISLELAFDDGCIHAPYQDMASKFLFHFVQIAEAIHTHGGTGLWDETDGFYYDHIRTERTTIALKTRSLVGLLPLIAVEILDEEVMARLPEFKERFEWHREHGKHLARHVVRRVGADGRARWILSLASRDRLQRILRYVADEEEFLSPHGIRSLSRYHAQHPFRLPVNGQTYEIAYTPGESRTSMFGGNSNWRGPVWFPINHLLIEALERYASFYEDDFQLEYPARSGQTATLAAIAHDLKNRQANIFRFTKAGTRPCHGRDPHYTSTGPWRDLVLFHEFFHGDDGRGLGASHQTGWTALVACHLEDLAAHPRPPS